MHFKPKKARFILDTLLQNGGDFAEIFIEKRKSRAIRFDNEKIDSISQGLDQGTGLRLINGKKTFYASSNSIEKDDLVKRSQTLAQGVQDPKQFQISQKFNKNRIKRIHKYKLDPFSVALDKKIKMLKKADKIIRSYDSRIIQSTILYRESKQTVEIYNSQGTMEKEKRIQLAMVFSAVAADKNGNIHSATQVLGDSIGYEIFTPKNVKQTAQEAARLAILQLEAKPAPAGSFTVVLHSEAGGTMIHEAVGHGLEGDFINKNLSIYSDRLGKMVASPLITVIDDGTIPNKRGTEKMDDEGHKTKKNILIKKGELVGFLHDRKSALESGHKFTGNGRRESFRHLPLPRMRNTYIKPGKKSPKKIIESVKDGILVKKMGGGQVDIVNGNFVFYVSEGYIIRDGKIQEAIRGATLTGNGPKVMETIDMVGSDLGFGIGTCGKNGQAAPVSDAQPTIRIPNIIVGGYNEKV